MAENSTINYRVQKAQCKFRQKGLVHTRRKSQSHGWKSTLDVTFHQKIGLQIRQICLQLKTFGAWLQLFMPAQSRKHWRHSNVVFGNLVNQFLWLLCKLSSVRCLTDFRQSSETKETLLRAVLKECCLLSRYCAIFGRCNITEYYSCCWAAICIIIFLT